MIADTQTRAQELVNAGWSTMQNHRPNAIGTLSQKFPYRLADAFYLLASKHRKGELLTTSELDFLEVITTTPFTQLKHKAWVLGNWYDIKPRELQSYNLAFSGKTVTKCRGFRKSR